jgi:hypothetical protein
MTQNGEMTTRQKIALGVSGAIIVAAAIYWTYQIISVIEFLQLAYGE